MAVFRHFQKWPAHPEQLRREAQQDQLRRKNSELTNAVVFKRAEQPIEAPMSRQRRIGLMPGAVGALNPRGWSERKAIESCLSVNADLGHHRTPAGRPRVRSHYEFRQRRRLPETIVTTPATRTVAAPPKTTEGTVPSHLAASPDSTAPH